MSRPIPLTDYERQLLAVLNRDDGAFQINTWALPLPDDTARQEADQRRALEGLKRKGYISAEGRGLGRQWWILDKGKEAL